MTAHGLPDSAVRDIHRVLARFPAVEQATLYLALAGNSLDALTLAALEDALDELLLPWRFDLSVQAQLRSPALQEHIARVGQLFYRRNGAGLAAD
jgi:hypothetical protein